MCIVASTDRTTAGGNDERQPERSSGHRWRGRAATADLRRRSRCRAPGENPVPDRLLTAQGRAAAWPATARRRVFAVPLQPACDAPGGDISKIGQTNQQLGHRRSVPLHAQPDLPGLHAVLQRYYRPRQLAPFRPAAPLRPRRHAARSHRTRGALPGAHFRRGVSPVQSTRPALDLSICVTPACNQLAVHGDCLAHAWDLLYRSLPSQKEAEAQPDKGRVYHETRKGRREEVERRTDDERYNGGARVDPRSQRG